MSKSTFKILFYLRKNQVNKDGTVSIMVRLSVNGEVAQFSSKLNIDPKAWDVSMGKAAGNSMKARQLNELLDNMRSAIKNHYHDIELHEAFVTAEKVKNAFLGYTTKQRTLLELFKKHNEDAKKLVGISKTAATLAKYDRGYRRMEEFIKYQYNLSDIALKEINHMFITDFETYLRSVSKCNENTTAKFMQTFRMIVIIAKNNGWIFTDPFANYRIRLKRVDRGYLTDAELQKIMKKKFPTKRLEQVRDVFLFSCYTGLSYVDVKELKASEICTSFDGKLWIMKHRQKTDTPVNVPLLKIPLAILKKYEGQLDEQLNILAFKYLNIGCNYFENSNYIKAAHSLEKGASILEHIHGSINVETKNKKIFCLISALSYYVCFQYSKSFILISKLKSDTVISSLISLFLNRDFDQLLTEIELIITDSDYDDKYLAEHFEEDNAIRIYEIIIAKSLNYYVQFYHTGNREFLEIAKRNLIDLQEIAEIRGEPDIWWVIRLLLLIIEGFKESSLWYVLDHYFNTKDKFPLKYIQSLVYKKGSITELFLTQRNSLPKVLNNEANGSIVSIPTSSGKTRIGEIAILNCLVNDPDAKILFIAPFRSLAYEIENSLDEIFSNLDVSVSHLYGGSLFSKLDEKIIDESSVIVATPEKAKALLRSSKDILSCIKLVIVDEGHLLGANKRLIVNEMFYEELRYHVGVNGGRFLLLSAVLPNAEDLSEWLTGSSDNVYKENWRPSDERIGIMEWNGISVNLNWRSSDTERNSFNPNFVVREELPKKPRQRVTHYFPENKNQAVATTAYKLKNFGPVLIFVGIKKSVFTIAREYEKCIRVEDGKFRFKSKTNWKAFKLACIESYGEDSEWLKFAEIGIFCHNSDLLSDVRLPLERLMRSEKPRVIIATSTLGQGVNLGVSTVIFSTLYQSGEPMEMEKMIQTLPIPEEAKKEMFQKGKIINAELLFSHTTDSGEFTLPEEVESRGTIRFMGIAVLLKQLLLDKKIISIDEIETSLHYELLSYFIKVYLANSNCPSQLILTTHDINLLDEDFIRRDAIWFTDKNSSGETILTRLSSLGLHKNLSPYNAYKQGKLVKLPFLGSIYLNDDHLCEEE